MQLCTKSGSKPSSDKISLIAWMKICDDHATFSDGFKIIALPVKREEIIGDMRLWNLLKFGRG